MLDVLPAISDLTLYRGDTFAQVLRFTQGGAPLALPTTGWAAEVRSPTGSGPVTGTFTVDSTQAGVGEIEISATAAQVAQFKDGAYDLRLTEGSTKRTFIRGKVTVVRDVTRA